jgi:hypothetical protein
VPRTKREIQEGQGPADRRIQNGRQHLVNVGLLAAQRLGHLVVAVRLIAQPVANEGAKLVEVA